MDYKQAFERLENGEAVSCIEYFKKNGYELELAYALFLTGKTNEAKKILQSHDSVRYDWLLKLINISEGKTDYPTFFQIRNFLEIDLSLLVKYEKYDYINNLLKMAQKFQGINGESYKFFGRGLLKNGYPKEAKFFLDKSLEDYYKDVELHYLFAEYYLYCGDMANAKKAAANCLAINPNYYPAVKLLKKHVTEC